MISSKSIYKPPPGLLPDAPHYLAPEPSCFQSPSPAPPSSHHALARCSHAPACRSHSLASVIHALARGLSSPVRGVSGSLLLCTSLSLQLFYVGFFFFGCCCFSSVSLLFLLCAAALAAFLWVTISGFFFVLI